MSSTGDGEHGMRWARIMGGSSAPPTTTLLVDIDGECDDPWSDAVALRSSLGPSSLDPHR